MSQHRKSITRRRFLGGVAALSAAAAAPSSQAGNPRSAPNRALPEAAGTLPVVIASANGWNGDQKKKSGAPHGSAVQTTMEMIRDPEWQKKTYGLLEAVVAGVGVTEADEDDHSVGLGGLPNEDGVVQLDSSVMFGPTHQAGAVGALENILHPAHAAMNVLKYTDHSFLVGEGAYRFARASGMPHTELLTEEAREIWFRWKQVHSDRDDWLPPLPEEGDPAKREQGTIHLSAVDGNGDVACVTTTSGLSFKIPGRVGDSPIVGAGMFCDNDIGTAGATGRGEEAIVNCGAFSVVEAMGRGAEPGDACLEVLKRTATNAKKRGLFKDGKPSFQLTFYAIRKDGAYGSACMLEGGKFAIIDGKNAEGRREPCAWLYDA